METVASPLVLTIVYWLHMLATVVWIGGLAGVSIFVLPAARRTLDAKAYGALLTHMGSRLQQVGWFSLGVLVGTGMFQMSASPFYKGFLAITNNWAIAILTKHLVVGLMVLVSGYVTWGLLPRLQRMALLLAAGRPVSDEQVRGLQNQETWMLRLNLALSVLVLLLTAWARSS